MIDVNHWQHVLSDCGVAWHRVLTWAPVFAVRARPEAFALGAREVPYFLGQVLHESSHLSQVEENLNYSAKRLTQVWPGRFPDIEAARPYAYNPEALANKTYGGRMGNMKPGDGWKYRGRGPIQITGRENYMEMDRETGLPLLTEPDLLLDPDTGLQCAVVWWRKNVPSHTIGSVEGVTLAVNGGRNGLAERESLTERAQTAFA